MRGVTPTDQLIAALQSAPMHAYDELAARSVAPPPTAPGIYAWWQRPGALPGVPGTPHPIADLELLYVGIAPARASSAGNLRKRLRIHHGAAIGSSTFRRSLAAFLWEPMGWSPEFTDRPVLSARDLAALSEWQRENTVVQWVVVEAPWVPEPEIVQAMRPPLNQDHNEAHPFYAEVGSARKRLGDAGRARQG